MFCLTLIGRGQVKSVITEAEVGFVRRYQTGFGFGEEAFLSNRNARSAAERSSELVPFGASAVRRDAGTIRQGVKLADDGGLPASRSPCGLQ
jgi:hypothetical protein